MVEKAAIVKVVEAGGAQEVEVEVEAAEPRMTIIGGEVKVNLRHSLLSTRIRTTMTEADRPEKVVEKAVEEVRGEKMKAVIIVMISIQETGIVVEEVPGKRLAILVVVAAIMAMVVARRVTDGDKATLAKLEIAVTTGEVVVGTRAQQALPQHP